MTGISLGILGLLLGSFLSVLLARWPHWRGVATGRSACPVCHHELAWYDLIPLASWLSTRGACRYCFTPISRWYPALELTMAVVLASYGWLFGVATWWGAIDVAILFLLVSLFFFDVRYHMLPDALTLPLVVIAIGRIALFRSDLLINALAMGVCLTAFFGLLYLLTRGRSLGFGDVKLACAMGVLFGFPMAIGVTLIAIWSGAAIGVGMMMRKSATMKTALPFGAFWVVAALVTLFMPGPVAFLSGLLIPVLP
ncbi:MAG: prepilin peptidase [Candidatus Pacebacteria bacterium]|nr:prepilin peptidase [Candidatus Paceibacterota bacterium]